MKKIILSLGFIVACIGVNAQNGLENIVVEKYYISDTNDAVANADGGVLPAGSVTYRIYADMLPGYKFQAAFGIPGHELRIETTTLFFNNEDRGNTTPTYTKTQAANNTVMLDSWLSVGAACAGNFGVLKSDDDGVATVVNNYSPQVLQNTDPLAGTPLSMQDGFLLGSPEPVTAVGISTEMEVFNAQNDGTNGPVFSTSNGSWASLNGSVGPNADTNRVLIAQITTDGVFSFELNVQLGTPIPGGVEQYVASNPVGNEIQQASLTYNSLTALVANLNSPSSSFTVYPNPSTDLITIEIAAGTKNNNKSYTIYDETGKVVLHKQLDNVSNKYADKVNVSSFARGTYFIEVNENGALSTKKIIIN